MVEPTSLEWGEKYLGSSDAKALRGELCRRYDAAAVMLADEEEADQRTPQFPYATTFPSRVRWNLSSVLCDQLEAMRSAENVACYRPQCDDVWTSDGLAPMSVVRADSADEACRSRRRRSGEPLASRS